MATKKAAKKAAAKPKAMTTDEAALAMLIAWRALKPQQRDWQIHMDARLSKKLHCRLRHEETRDSWNPISHYGSGFTLTEAITKALAAAKKAGHA